MSQVAEFDVADFEDPNSTKGTYARFYIVPKKDEAASAEAGAPVFVDREYIEIMAAGNANNIIRRPATDMDKQKYRRVYDLFKQGDIEQVVGMRLTEIPWITRSQVEELAYKKVYTVEALSEIADVACQVPGMHELRKKARAWVQTAKDAVPFTSMQAQIDKLTAELDALKAQKPAKG